jgi:hypothetical protein
MFLFAGSHDILVLGVETCTLHRNGSFHVAAKADMLEASVHANEEDLIDSARWQVELHPTVDDLLLMKSLMMT